VREVGWLEEMTEKVLRRKLEKLLEKKVRGKLAEEGAKELGLPLKEVQDVLAWAVRKVI
jgi:hypothetical protein